jgi:hypothetical protein
MKQVLAYLLIILAVAGLEFACTQPAHAQTNGLNYQNYAAGGAMPSYTQDANGNITNRTLLTTGTVNTVGLTTSSGTGIPTRSDNFIVRFYGYINIPTTGTYYFGGQADDGIRIKVNNVSVVNSWIESGGDFRQGSINLSAGIVPVEIMYYENGGGQMVNFQWYQNNSWQIVSSANLYTSMPAPQYASSITAAQQSTYNAAISRRNNITQNSIYIDQVGSNNTFNNEQTGKANKIAGVGADAMPVHGDWNTIITKQGNVTNPYGKNLIEANVYGSFNYLNLNQGQSVLDYGGHIQTIQISGNNNSITTDQRNSGNYGHYLNTNITGNNNTQNISQSGNAIKQTFVVTNGSNNSLSALQDGLGGHYLDVTSNGNNNDAIVNQTGNTKNAATIILNNQGAPASITLNQSGGQTYNIERTCTTTCGRVTVSQ